MSISVNQLRSGSKVMVDGTPYNVVENEHVKPGKGQAFNRLKMRNMLNGRVIQKTHPSGATLEAADVVETQMNLLYIDQSGYHLMDTSTYEQYVMLASEVGESKKWLKDEALVVVVVWNGRPISVLPENFVELEITECAPNAKGDTVTGGTKLAMVETGIEIKVPLFVEQGDVIRIDTRTEEYVSRAGK
ncbi:elongation factor P [Candidatus Synchoanobacter obligatus]|uniref:Elongation factor P n=1 Tax=Candidatus Synchoanobacter obligatus TaxID=2919597 RepID=A0ABT1L611_9GAMM|nr:elongation factor P [Candidatus Synchoanobacter obligatus]